MSEILVIIRPSFMKFCEDGCRSALFNHVLYWIAKKSKGQPREKILSGEITYYATNEELVEQMAGAWGYQKIRKETNDLIDMGILGRGKNPAFGADRTKHFYFGVDQCKKLLELCRKHDINLSKIGLPSEMTDLIKQFTNPSNAIDQSVKCSEHKQFTNPSNQNDKSVNAITKDTTKDSCSKDNERKNDEPQQNSTVFDQQGSFIPSSNILSSSLSSQETKPAIEFSPEAERIYGFAEKLKLARLKRNETNRDYCETLAKEITSQEQMDSLAAYSREKLKHKGKVELYLGNLVTDVNGWSQVQEQTKKSTVSNEEVTDSDIADMVETWSRLYKDTEHIKENQARVKDIQNECRMSNNKFFDTLFKAKDDTDYSGDISMRSFFRMLNRQLGRNPVTVGNRHLQPLISRSRS